MEKETDYNIVNNIDETLPLQYHGTTIERAESIKKIGFYKQHNVNVTDDLEEAQEYANMVAEDEDSKPAIIKVRLRKGAKPMAEEGLDALAFDANDIVLDYSEL